jgi:hypothetical protein
MGGTQVDTHSHTPLMRIGRGTGFRDLQKGHGRQ